jgi:hypothetical protein
LSTSTPGSSRQKEYRDLRAAAQGRHRDSATTFADAPSEFRFATAVAEYVPLLRESKFAAASGFDHVLAAADQARGADRGGYRAEFIELVKAARALSSTISASEYTLSRHRRTR